MRAKHSPGEWTLDETPVEHGFANEVIHVHVGSEIIAQLWLTDVFDGTIDGRRAVRLANGRLVAAAPRMFDALDECDTAFAVLNITDGLTPQARKCVGEAWAKVQAAMLKAAPDHAVGRAAKEQPQSAMNLKEQRDALLQVCKELTVQIGHFVAGTLVTWPVALIPQAQAAIDAVEA